MKYFENKIAYIVTGFSFFFIINTFYYFFISIQDLATNDLYFLGVHVPRYWYLSILSLILAAFCVMVICLYFVIIKFNRPDNDKITPNHSVILTVLYLRAIKSKTIINIIISSLSYALCILFFSNIGFLHTLLVEPYWLVIYYTLICWRYIVIKYRINNGVFGSNPHETRELIRFISENSKNSHNKDNYNSDAFLPENIINPLVFKPELSDASI